MHTPAHIYIYIRYIYIYIICSHTYIYIYMCIYIYTCVFDMFERFWVKICRPDDIGLHMSDRPAKHLRLANYLYSQDTTIHDERSLKI